MDELFKHYIRVEVTSSEDAGFWCEGVLVDWDKVITAAHCVSHFNKVTHTNIVQEFGIIC